MDRDTTLPVCQNTTMRVNGAWIKRYCVLCPKTYATLHSCHNFPAGSRQAARVARICETSLIICYTVWPTIYAPALQWRHTGRNGVSNYQRLDCLFNRLLRHILEKTSKLRVTGLVRGIHRWPVNSPHTWPETRKMFPFDDVIMRFAFYFFWLYCHISKYSFNRTMLPPATHVKKVLIGKIIY